MTETPQVLLSHHLKKPRLPTFLSEHDKLARQCAAEGKDHVQYLLRAGFANSRTRISVIPGHAFH